LNKGAQNVWGSLETVAEQRSSVEAKKTHKSSSRTERSCLSLGDMETPQGKRFNFTNKCLRKPKKTIRLLPG